MTDHLSDKAVRYLTQLDTARCEGRWRDIPELSRKAEKHAPQRRGIVVTARIEAQLATISPEVSKESPAGANDTPIDAAITQLQSVSQDEGALAEDRFEANVCLAWAFWLRRDTGLAIEALPTDSAAELKSLLEGQRTLGQSVRVCAMKAAYIRGHALEIIGALPEATQNYLSMLPYLSSFTTFKSASPQFCLWTQCLLTRLCAVSGSFDVAGSGMDINTKLWFYNVWETFWTTSASRRQVSGYDPRNALGLSWRDVWFTYYKTLGDVLQRAWLYAPGQATGTMPRILESTDSLSNDDYLASRLRQRADLKKIEAMNESFLLQETVFPKATERNEAVEVWVDEVIRNWRVMCGPTWQDQEVGEGGKEAVSREILDILYRAATKTFHSTQVLRHLFIVHASLAEFDLALKAFDSYVEIFTRQKERQDKSGKLDNSLDDDDTVLQTYSEAIRILCRFGDQKEVEKAREIAQRIEDWLKQITSTPSHPDFIQGDAVQASRRPLSPKTMVVALRAIGLSSAYWSRLTYDAKSRAGLQAHAVQYLGKALDPKYGDPLDDETRCALGLLLAEMRDIVGAIKVIKQALAPLSSSASGTGSDAVSVDEDQAHFASGFVPARKAIPLWHLLGLLLSARFEFDTAGRACDAAFEQFRDPSYLFGIEKQQFHSDHLNAISNTSTNEKPLSRKTKGAVDLMGAFEKESILQVKLTQIALIESLEGSSAAVDTCDQLLSLYARLFGDPSSTTPSLKPPYSLISPPKTARSFRHSILGRSNDSKRLASRPKSGVPSTYTAASRPSSSATTITMNAPTIQVTDEDAASPSRQGDKQHRALFRHSTHSSRPGSRRAESVKSKARKSLVDVAEEPLPPFQSSTEPTHNMEVQEANTDAVQYHAISNDDERLASNGVQPLSRIAVQSGQFHSQNPPDARIQQSIRLPLQIASPRSASNSTILEPRFSGLQERRHKVSLLVQVWLFTAGLYKRATMYNDAWGATEEASKLVEAFEQEVAVEDSSARGFATRGWGAGKSVDELWADVYAEKGHLARAQELPHDGLEHFEKALLRFPDHPSATVGLSEILLDIYCLKIPPEPVDPESLLPSTYLAEKAHLESHSAAANGNASKPPLDRSTPVEPATPQELNRLAARDRAYSLLSSLTKLGSGWDYSEAWFALARAYEESGQIEKAKEMLWWTVELEDTRPIRSWQAVRVCGGVIG